MQDKHLFEYAVIRVVPKVEREEFMNVGVVLYCANQDFLQVLFSINKARFCAFAPKLNVDEVEASLQSFKRICDGGAQAGPIGLYPTAERFRWLTAARSTIIQSSCVHPGLCTDAQQTLLKLYNELVEG